MSPFADRRDEARLKSPGPVRTGFADRVALATDELLSVDLSEADIVARKLTCDELDGF